MRISSKFSHVYVVAPAGVTTGGVELLHQLVAEVVKLGGSASICYLPFGGQEYVTDRYKEYICPVAQIPLDGDEIAVVIPEIYPGLVNRYKKATKFLWWMSVDNFFGGSVAPVSLRMKRFAHLIKLISNSRTIHLCQSTYAENFLRRTRARSVGHLSDYVNSVYETQNSHSHRRDIVAFNPSKGLKNTKKIMSYNEDIDFTPLEGLSAEGVRARLSECKVYIDFGNHPGKDRIPREAALCGCVVLVGRKGAACNPVDIPIADFFKFDNDESSLKEVGPLIRSVFNEYDSYYGYQEFYRYKIRGERFEFTRDVLENFFCISNS